ncbi:MAG: hypothetical protein Q9M37_09860 [Desulfonauticus sp.]|nr:hypothetical protein [Desulfonauticus sp.]
MTDSYDYKEILDFFEEKKGKLNRDESFAVYGFGKAMYLSEKITLKEYQKILEKIPVDDEELMKVTI